MFESPLPDHYKSMTYGIFELLRRGRFGTHVPRNSSKPKIRPLLFFGHPDKNNALSASRRRTKPARRRPPANTHRGNSSAAPS